MRDTLVGKQTSGCIGRKDRKEASTGRKITRTDRTQYQQFHLSQSKQSQLSIFLSVNKKIIDIREQWHKGRRINRTKYGWIDRRGTREGKTHQQEGGVYIRTGDRNNRQNIIPTISAIYIAIYQRKEALEKGSICKKGQLTQQTERTHQQVYTGPIMDKI